jgi:hypothetical protein
MKRTWLNFRLWLANTELDDLDHSEKLLLAERDRIRRKRTAIVVELIHMDTEDNRSPKPF